MKKINRRDLILGGASLVALGGAAAYTRVMRSKPVVRETGPEIPAFVPERDLEGLTHPMKAYAKIGNVELSRLILGGNMIGGWAHARDMGFYGRLVKAYFTDERVFRNFRIAEACGVNTILTNPALMRVINRYWREEGGKIKFISDCGYPGGVIKGAIASVENGASMVYCHGGHADTNAVVKKDWKFFREYLDESRKLGVPVGIGCHSLQTVKFCVEHDCIPDFWMKTVHKVDYPTAHLNEDRKKNATGLGSCDNRFVDTDRQEVFDYMAHGSRSRSSAPASSIPATRFRSPGRAARTSSAAACTTTRWSRTSTWRTPISTRACPSVPVLGMGNHEARTTNRA